MHWHLGRTTAGSYRYCTCVDRRGQAYVLVSIAKQRVKAYIHQNCYACGNGLLRQVFYGILVQHFVILAGEEPLPLQMMDAVAAVLQPMTSEASRNKATCSVAIAAPECVTCIQDRDGTLRALSLLCRSPFMQQQLRKQDCQKFKTD